jgi:hypothetical protein
MFYKFKQDSNVNEMRDELVIQLTRYNLSGQAISNLDTVLEIAYISGRISAKQESIALMSMRNSSMRSTIGT